MKKLICFLLALSIATGGFVFSAFAEESSADTEISQEASTPADDPVSQEPSVDSSVEDSSVEDSSVEDSSVEDSSVVDPPSDQVCSVTMQYDTACGKVTGFVENGTYYVGQTLTVTISPFTKKGVKSVTVNGVALSNVPVAGGAVSIPLQSETVAVVIEFGDTVGVIIDCAEGGSFTVEGYPNATAGSTFHVLVGSDVVIKISANANQAIRTVADNKQDVTSNLNGRRYTIKAIDTVHHIVINFREVSDADVETFSVNVMVEGNGSVSPLGIVSVEKGGYLDLTLTPDIGYVVKSVTDDGQTFVVSGNSYVVRNVYADRTVIVVFAKEGGGSDISQPPVEEPSKPDVQPENKGYITRQDVLDSMDGNVVDIQIKDKTKVGKDALEYISQLAQNSALTVRIGVNANYFWILPTGVVFDTSNLTDDGIDFGVYIDKGETATEIKRLLTEKGVTAKYNYSANLAIARASKTVLPAGTRLKVYVAGAFAEATPGKCLSWLKYDYVTREITSAYTNGALVTVGTDGYVTVDMADQQFYGALAAYTGQHLTVDVNWNSTGCDISVPGTVKTGENGQVVSTIAWESGTDFELTVTLKNGFAIDSISSDNLTLAINSYGVDVTKNGGKGEKGNVVIKVAGISKGGTINVNTTEADSATAKTPGAKTPWDVIILIAVIVIAMVAGGIVFVVKWRQNDDDDDDEDDDFDEDDFDDQ